MKYRNRLAIVEAMQFTSDEKDRCFNFVTCNRIAKFDPSTARPVLEIATEHGDVVAEYGDWIVKENEGCFGVWTDAQFSAEFEPLVEKHEPSIKPKPPIDRVVKCCLLVILGTLATMGALTAIDVVLWFMRNLGASQ